MRQHFNKNSIMVKVALSMLMLICGTFTAVAQEEMEDDNNPKKEQTFRFVYVAPDNPMSKETLLNDLKDVYENTVKSGSPTIFYLANGKKPIIVEFNTGMNNQDDYEIKFVQQINTNKSWIVDISDRQRIRELLLQHGIFDSEGQLAYGRTEVYFHVGKEFWEGRRNETIIGALYFDLDAAKYKGKDALFQYNVYFYCPPAMNNYKWDKPFGDLNPDGINDAVNVRSNRQKL